MNPRSPKAKHLRPMAVPPFLFRTPRRENPDFARTYTKCPTTPTNCSQPRYLELREAERPRRWIVMSSTQTNRPSRSRSSEISGCLVGSVFEWIPPGRSRPSVVGRQLGDFRKCEILGSLLVETSFSAGLGFFLDPPPSRRRHFPRFVVDLSPQSAQGASSSSTLT